MILVTVGTQLPFDRLISALDAIAPSVARPMFAQTGKGRYAPTNMEWQPLVEPAEFETRIRSAELIVAHAGIGTVLMAQRHRKPIILFPRRADLHEHRNNHQMATARALENREGIHIAWTEERLADLIGQPLSAPAAVERHERRDSLCEAIVDFIDQRR